MQHTLSLPDFEHPDNFKRGKTFYKNTKLPPDNAYKNYIATEMKISRGHLAPNGDFYSERAKV